MSDEPVILILVRDTTDIDTILRLKEVGEYKTSLLHQVSHEIRNPLNAIINLQESLIKEVRPEIKRKILDPAINSSKLLLNLIQDMLDFAQMRKGKFRVVIKPCFLKQEFDDSMALINTQASIKGIKTELI